MRGNTRRTSGGLKRWLKRIGIGFALLLVVAVAGALFFLTRPPRPAKIYAPGPTGIRVTDHGLFANYFPAAGGGRRPGILLLGGSEGGLFREPLRVALLLQRQGYNVLQLAYHNAPGTPASLANVPLERFATGLDWLKARPEVDAASLGVVGVSKGAEAALLTATRYPGLKAVVAGMPSSVAWDGMDSLSILAGLHSSWTEGGRPVPSLHYGWYDSKRGLYAVFVDGLKTVGKHPDAVIPIERFGGRLLLICGGSDTLWPSCAMADQVAARAAKTARPAVQLLRYPGAGHAVFGVPLPATDRDMRGYSSLGGTPQANAAARADNWPKVLAFLHGALDPR